MMVEPDVTLLAQGSQIVDEQLSRAVVAYLLGGRYVRPGESPDAVAGALGAEAAEHLLPRLRELAREAVCWPVNWQENDDVSAMRVVEREIAGAHPELSAEAVRALSQYFSFCNR
jgi:hypothetical protein